MSNVVFNEEEYLIANPDVALAIKQGAFKKAKKVSGLAFCLQSI